MSSFEKAVIAIIKDNTPVMVTEGTVTKVDKVANTCNIERDQLPELFKVRLNPVLEAGTNVITVYPQVGSKVLCLLVNNDPNDAYVLALTDIDEIIINGGANGGLTITPALVTELGKNNEYVETLKDATKAIALALDALVPGTSTVFDATMSTVTPGDYSEIENEKIKH